MRQPSLTNKFFNKMFPFAMNCWYVIACAFIFYINNFKNRHPKTTGRPSFASLHHKLSRPESLLLKWTDGDKTRDPQSFTIFQILWYCTRGAMQSVQELETRFNDVKQNRSSDNDARQNRDRVWRMLSGSAYLTF